MLKDLCKLSLVLLLILAVWAVYERQFWYQDYSRYEAPVLNLPYYDDSFEQHIRPTYFKEATVLSNDTHLQYPEDLAVSGQGVIYTGLRDGSIVSLSADSNETTTLVSHPDVGGIYGIILTSDDSTLYYATELKGLVKLDLASRQFEFVVDEVEGKPVGGINAVAIDEANQMLYMTDASPIRMPQITKEVILAHKQGKVIQYDLKTRTASILIDSLAFPNGIVYEPASHSIIFSELTQHRVWKHDLKKGQSSILLDNFFGFADNLKLSDKGDLLIATITTRDALKEFANDKPFLRKILLYVPDKLFYALLPKRAGGVRVNPSTGEIMEYMLGAPTKIKFVSTIVERKGKLYFSSLKSPTIIILNSSQQSTSYDKSVQSPQL